jgi:pimeloyl-ACP methyl ester carboxylesterase
VIVDPERIRCPVLAISGADDRVASPTSLRETARQLGADIREYPSHGHWIIGEGGGEEIVREIHRWLVKELGEEILLAEFSQRE